MTQIFEKQTDGVIYVDADSADLYAGGLVHWNDVDGGKTPSGYTWNKSAAARMEFTFTVDTAGTFQILGYLKTFGTSSSVWLSVNGGDNTYQKVFNTGGYFSWIYLLSGISLQAGTHKIILYSVDSEIEIGRFAVASDSSAGAFTTYGPAAVSTGTAPIVQNDTYADWLNDDSRDPVRALLLEMDYNGGTIRIGSAPYMSSNHLAYDDGMLSDPYMEESITGDLVLGDVEFVVEDPDVDLNSLEFRGYPCRWLYGDLEWDIADFRTISTTIIETVRQTGINTFQTDLLPVSDIYETTFHTGDDFTYSGTTRTAITYLLDSLTSAGTVTYINILDNVIDDTDVTFEVSENTTVSDLITLICNGISGHYRTSQDGNLEIIVPDLDHNPVLAFNSDNIIKDSISVIETIPAYKRVTINYGVGDETFTLETEAETGTFDDEIVIETALLDLDDATNLAYKMVEKYGRQQSIYSFDVVNMVDVVLVGDFCILNSNFINSMGVVQSIKRTPLTTASTIEVLI